MRMLVTLLVCYALMCAVMFALQRKLLYLPGPGSTSDLRTLGVERWPQAEPDYLGLMGADPVEPVIANVIVFHGNAGSAVDRRYYVAALERRGFRVFINEYPGYGGRPGSPSEATVTQQAERLVAAVAQAFPEPVFLWGESLGAGVAGSIASRVDAAGVVLLTPWDSLPNVAQAQFWFLPARWLVLDQYDTVENLRDYEGPVAVIVAENDEVIAPRHGRNLFASLSGEKRFWEFAEAGHNSWPAAEHHEWWTEVTEYLTQSLGDN